LIYRADKLVGLLPHNFAKEVQKVPNQSDRWRMQVSQSYLNI